MPRWSCSPTTVRKWARLASRSATPTKGATPGASLTSPTRKAPGRARPRAPGVGCWVGGLLRRQNLEHPRAAHRAYALQRRPAVGHLHLLGIRNLALGLALHAVPLIRGHRGFSTLRH